MAAALVWVPVASPARVLVVDPRSVEFPTIQMALSAAADGDSVLIRPGIYPEQLTLRRSVTIQGAGPDSTILEGQGSWRILDAGDADVVIRGLTFRNGQSDQLGGGGVLFTAGSLRISGCVFRGNRASYGDSYEIWGGAVCFQGEDTEGEVEDCLFVGNRAVLGQGAAIGFMITGWLPPFPATSSLRVSRSSFVDNEARTNAAVRVGRGVTLEVSSCVFVDRRTSSDPGYPGSSAPCNIYWPYPSPVELGAWPEKSAMESTAGSVTADPLLCPGDPEHVHESSPTQSLAGCGVIGNLPVGCRGPMILDARPRVLASGPDEVLQIYGYALGDLQQAVLLDPLGRQFPGERTSMVDGRWVTLRFDLSRASAGPHKLELRFGDGSSSSLDSLAVSSMQALGFLDGWVEEPQVWEGKLFGHGFETGLSLTLVQDAHLAPAEPGAAPKGARTDERGPRSAFVPEARVALQVLSVSVDTVTVRGDLTSAPDGGYRLEISSPDGEANGVSSALFLGPPPVLRVPEDHAGIQAALDAAEPYTEIQVSPGTYPGSLTVSKPVRLTGAAGARSTVVTASGGRRALHVRREAGSLTEISGLTIRNGDPSEGPGGGVWCQAPALIAHNFVFRNRANGPGGWGGGIAGADGCRIIGNEIVENEAMGEGGPHIWLESGAPGSGGGLRCTGCLVEGNRLESNVARACGQIVADGILLADTVGYGSGTSSFDDRGWPGCGLVRGRIERCTFRNSCGSQGPYLRIDGPSEVRYSTFTDVVGDLCNMPAVVALRGSVDFDHNTLAGVSSTACLLAPVDSPTVPHFRMHDNIVFDMGLYLEEPLYSVACLDYEGGVPTQPIPRDSIQIGCNLGSVTIATRFDRIACDSCTVAPWDPQFCAVPCVGEGCSYEYDLRVRPDSPALPGNREPGCPDTLGALPPGCEVVPVLLGAHGLEWLDDAVRLYWNVPAGVTPWGFFVERDAGGVVERLTPEPLRGCERCEYVDSAPPAADELWYWLIVLSGDGGADRILLGQVDGLLSSRRGVHLGAPAPNPARGSILIRYYVPRSEPHAQLDLTDAAGRHVAVIHDGPVSAGPQTVCWLPRDREGRSLASGVYFIRLRADRVTRVQRLLLLR